MAYWLMADRLEPEVYRAAAVADEGCKTQEGSHLIGAVDALRVQVWFPFLTSRRKVRCSSCRKWCSRIIETRVPSCSGAKSSAARSSVIILTHFLELGGFSKPVASRNPLIICLILASASDICYHHRTIAR